MLPPLAAQPASAMECMRPGGEGVVRRHPPLRLRLPAGQDQAVEAAFVATVIFGLPPDGVTSGLRMQLIQAGRRHGRIAPHVRPDPRQYRGSPSRHRPGAGWGVDGIDTLLVLIQAASEGGGAHNADAPSSAPRRSGFGARLPVLPAYQAGISVYKTTSYARATARHLLHGKPATLRQRASITAETKRNQCATGRIWSSKAMRPQLAMVVASHSARAAASLLRPTARTRATLTVPSGTVNSTATTKTTPASAAPTASQASAWPWLMPAPSR